MKDTPPAAGVRRHLKTRHLSMIAIGGSIGTGLFMASGSAIHEAGPGGALLAYAAIGLMVYFLMTSLGEMAFCHHNNMFVACIQRGNILKRKPTVG